MNESKDLAYNEFMTPPKTESKPWQDLTDEEIDSIEWPANQTLSEYARAVEARLRTKNSGY